MATTTAITAIGIPDIHINLEHEKGVKRDRISSNSDNGSDFDDKPNLDNIRIIPRPPKQNSYDSGSSNGEDDEVNLTDHLREKIITQAENYFSDENLSRDGFLLKHVKRTKEGFVNLKLLASFKKMRSLSRDYRVIGEALQTSTKLIVNETGLKLRRVDPLPKELLDHPRVKSIVISNMCQENPSMDYIIAAFSKHKDNVISVRVVKPDKKFPNDLQSHFSRHPELKTQIVAVVEFDSPENAAAGIKCIDKDNYSSLDVKLLELGPKQAKRMSRYSESTASDTPIRSDSSGSSQKVKKKTDNNKVDNNSSSSDSDWSSFSSCSKRYSRSHGSRSPSPLASPYNTPKNKSNIQSGSESPNNKRNTYKSPIRKMSPLAASENLRSSLERDERNDEEKSGNLRPWMYHRMQLSKDSITDSVTQKHLEIIRHPKGPDGSFGFSSHPLKKYVLVHAY